MDKISPKKLFFLAIALMPLTISCVHRPLVSPNITNKEESVSEPKREINLLVLPQSARNPSQILFKESVRYHHSGGQSHKFKRELIINPLMHEISFKARVMRGTRVVREYTAQKSVQTILSDKKTMWTAGRAKLVLDFNLAPGEEVVVNTEYAWMDPRYLWPIFLEGSLPTGQASITIDVPFGVDMRHKISKEGGSFDLIPKREDIKNLRWGTKDNRIGLGTRYIFEHDFGLKTQINNKSDRMQLFLAFDMPMQHENSSLFNSWEAVSTFLYNRIDRYDLPSNTIRDFVEKECADKDTDLAKIMRVLSFLKNDIEKRALSGSFLEQEVQPAIRTFTRRFGSSFDIAILGKAMLSSLGIKADLLALSSPDENPTLTDFYSPALFSKIVLSIKTDDKTFYVDPGEDLDRIDLLPLSMQGQNALSMNKEKGQFFTLPYDDATHNEAILSYELSLSPQGQLEGGFSLDINGVRAESLRAILAKKERSLSAPELQSFININDQSLRWRSAVLSDPKNSDNMNIKGYIAPRLVQKNMNSFSFDINEILQPAFSPIFASSQAYSTITRVFARISIPENYAVSQLPDNGIINGDGISGRYTIQLMEGALYFEGETIVSLPVPKNFKKDLEDQLKTLARFGETKLGISLIEHGNNNNEKPGEAQSS